MRLLIITQKIDEQDAVLGFMHGWIAEFSKNVDSVVAICLEKGRVNFSGNVRVFSLGKERGVSKFGLLVNFYKIIWRERKNYDAVFAHMNPEYIVLGGLFWKLWGKTVTLWYAHKSVPWHLRVAHIFTDIVFTSTASGFRLPSRKVKVIGQGIDVEKFKSRLPAEASAQAGKSKVKSEEQEFKIVTVGRITPSKDYDTLIDAVERVRLNFPMPITVAIVGPVSLVSDRKYLQRLQEKVIQKDLAGIITFPGPVPNAELPQVLQMYDLFVNMGHTGSLDKAVPEAMAMELPVLTCNEAFQAVLGPFTRDLMYAKGDAEALAGKIEEIARLSEEERRALGKELRAIVVRDHSRAAFVKKIVAAIETRK